MDLSSVGSIHPLGLLGVLGLHCPWLLVLGLHCPGSLVHGLRCPWTVPRHLLCRQVAAKVQNHTGNVLMLHLIRTAAGQWSKLISCPWLVYLHRCIWRPKGCPEGDGLCWEQCMVEVREVNPGHRWSHKSRHHPMHFIWAADLWRVIRRHQAGRSRQGGGGMTVLSRAGWSCHAHGDCKGNLFKKSHHRAQSPNSQISS